MKNNDIEYEYIFEQSITKQCIGNLSSRSELIKYIQVHSIKHNFRARIHTIYRPIPTIG